MDLDARIRRLVARLSDLTGIAFTFGYLGDVSGIPGTPAYRDSRCYYVFAAHPGRVGTSSDRLGGVSDPNDLVPILRGALALATVQATAR
jgi:hypothetical protein